VTVLMHIRTFIVARSEAGLAAGTVVRRRLALAWPTVLRVFRERRVRVAGRPCVDVNYRLRAGQRVGVALPRPRTHERAPASDKGPRTKDKGPRPVIRFADAHLVVVDKPAGLTTMRHPEEASEFGVRGRRFLPPTLADLLPGLLAAGPAGQSWVRAVHRLDKDTTGLVVFARTVEAERHLGRQFRAHTIERRYLAVVRGRAKAGRVESRLVRDRGDGRRGSTPEPGAGQLAVTHVLVIEELADFTLVECRLETGRTHQVRIHLGESGTPVCGECVYDRPVHGKPLPDTSGTTRLALHAASLGFIHPATGLREKWESPLPGDLAALVQRLRKRARAAERLRSGPEKS
jgi:23S rRNA pseudouridine1911/1915/1917 synthase